MTELENLSVAPIVKSNEEAERLEAAFFNEEYDDSEQEGLDGAVILDLLNKVGATGESPDMATVLYRAGTMEPTPNCYTLYGQRDSYSSSDTNSPVLFSVHMTTPVQADSIPDALLLARGTGRKAYRGYKVVMTDLWVNPDSPHINGNEREVRDAAQKLILSGNPSDYIFVEPDTLLHEIGSNAAETIEELGIKPEKYAEDDEAPALEDRMARIEDPSLFSGQPLLLETLQSLYASTKPDVEAIGFEGEDLYKLELHDLELIELNNYLSLQGDERITGLSIEREDRPEGRFIELDDIRPRFYTNGWGDMTIVLRLERGALGTTYTLRVEMDEGDKRTFLNKYTTESHTYSDDVTKNAAHLLSSQESLLDEHTRYNEIDDLEYQSIVNLVQNVQKAVEVTTSAEHAS